MSYTPDNEFRNGISELEQAGRKEAFRVEYL